MAAGIPVIVSDWDGYRYTVTDGLEGFLIPTWLLESQQGVDLSFSHDHGLVSYQDYVGAVAQHVAVDVEAASVQLSVLQIIHLCGIAWVMLDSRRLSNALTGPWWPNVSSALFRIG